MNKRPLVRLRSLRVMSGKNPESGAVLVVSLIMLLLLTLIGVTAMQTTSLEEKMAGNLRDKNLAFQAAESALRVANNNLLTYLNSLPLAVTIPLTPDATYTGGFYPSTIPTDVAILTDSFWTDATRPKATSTVAGLGNGIDAHPPVYIIQKLSDACINFPCPPHSLSPVYRITVRAAGASTNTVVI